MDLEIHSPLEKNSQGVESVSFTSECLCIGHKHLSGNYQQPEAHLFKSMYMGGRGRRQGEKNI